MPPAILVDVIYDVFMSGYDQEQRADLDEMLAIPFNVHPANTPKAKAERAAMFNQMLQRPDGG